MQTVIPDFTWQPSTRERYNDQLNVLFPAEWIGQAPPRSPPMMPREASSCGT